jgi:hypothetical protein
LRLPRLIALLAALLGAWSLGVLFLTELERHLQL